MSNRSSHQHVIKSERGSSASQVTSIEPKNLPCYNLSPGNHYTTGTHSSRHKTASLRGTQNFLCQISKKCQGKSWNSLKELKDHISDQHMEKLCGFIGSMNDRTEHADASPCHDGSLRRVKRQEYLTRTTEADERKRYNDGERRRKIYEEEDRERMSRNGGSSGANGGSRSGGTRRLQ